MKHVRHYDLGGFDEPALLDDEEMELSLIGTRPRVKSRPDRPAPARSVRRRRKFERGESFRRRVREKAWGMPY